MKNKVLKTIGYIVGITWLFTACALDDEVYGMTMLFINVLCTAYLALFSWENNWWYDLEDYEDEDDEEYEEPLHYCSTSSGRRGREYGSHTRQVGHNSSRTLQSVNDSPLRTGKTRNLAGTKGSGRRAV